ncbi:MAG: hypothetical protein AAGI38_15160 [Bacteroidota bacterium]
MHITGKVVFVNLSGGFWGIESDDGTQYKPVEGLPSDYQQEGLRVTATAKPVEGMSIFMWGESVQLRNIKKTS